jgi:hypothetical protein
LLVKSVADLLLELPAAKDHPAVQSEIKRAMVRAREGAMRLGAKPRPAIGTRPRLARR